MIVIRIVSIRNTNHDNKLFFSVSSWKLVYFLKHKSSNAVVDSRVTENINATHLFPVVGPRGVYRYRTHLDVSQHLSKSMSKYITINTKLDIKGRATLGRAVTEVLKSSITGRHHRFVEFTSDCYNIVLGFIFCEVFIEFKLRCV